ncbi:hypothetical protein QAD02_023353, partial [Eretmocerus hayati]
EESPDHATWYKVINQRMDEDDYGEGFIAESHPLRPTHLNVPLGGMGNRDSRAPSISSSVTDMDVPIYTRETTMPLAYKKLGLAGASNVLCIVDIEAWNQCGWTDNGESLDIVWFDGNTSPEKVIDVLHDDDDRNEDEVSGDSDGDLSDFDMYTTDESDEERW